MARFGRSVTIVDENNSKQQVKRDGSAARLFSRRDRNKLYFAVVADQLAKRKSG